MKEVREELGREALSADMLGQTLLKRIVDTWMETEFEGGRHVRRVSKIAEIEAGRNPAG